MERAAFDPAQVLATLREAAGAWVWDVQGERLYADARFAHLSGLDQAEAREGLPTAAFVSNVESQDKLRVRIALAGVMHGSETFTKEYRVRGSDGVVRWVSARGRAERTIEGDLRQFTGVMVDITDQKRIEERLRIAQTAGGIGSFEHTDGFGTADVSDQFCRLLGLQATDALPVRTINAVIHPEDPVIIRSVRPQEDRENSYSEMRIRRADTGEERWLARRGEHRTDGVGGGRFIGVIYDITAAKRAEEGLRDLTHTLEQRVAERTRERDRVWNRARDLFLILSPDRTYRAVNPAWSELLGYPPEDLIGNQNSDLVHPDDLDRASEAFGRLLEGERVENLDLRMKAKSGEFRRIDWTIIPEGDVLYAMGRDVTERAQLEEQLRQSQKMEAVGQLTGGLAHDFNNLLTGITGSLELLQTRIAQGRVGEIDRYVSAAEGAAKRAAALTHRLLAFSRRQTLAPKATDANRLISGLEEMIRRTMGPSIGVETVASGGLWTVQVDPNQLENAILNLCINARDAMPEGGHLTIETANRWIDGRTAREREMPPGQYVSICVSDDGGGMPPEIVARVFDPFFTTKPIGQGTGLGLSMIYGFARQSNGEVRIYSEVGKGTMVCIYLPRHLGAAEYAEEAKEWTSAPRSSLHETVLIVDDEPAIRMLVTEVLEDLGYHALEATDGASAMSVLRSQTRIDLLVTDVGLPGGVNGRQIADAARVDRPDLKVLFITGYAENAVLSHGHLDPGMHVMTKPFSMDELARRIRELISETA